MDPEFSVEKQSFTIAKEKIIKTNELLLLYNEKNETLNKAKNAFKQLKSKYEATVHEVDRLKLDNERLNFNFEAIKSKSQQNEKDLKELQADYKKTDERYQQTMIDSQQTISNLEEKLKHCTCETKLLLSPTKGRSVNEKVKELKQKCCLLMKSESNLKNCCDNLQLKNKQLIEEKLEKSQVIKDLTAKNAELLSDLTSLKKVQKLERGRKDDLNLEHTLKSLKQSYEKKVHSLKMEISKLSLDNQRTRYLELECQNLKQQINNKKEVNVEKSHGCVQTEVSSYFNKFNSNQDIGIQTAIIEPLQTLKVMEDDSSDMDYALNDILSEMIIPKALSPMSFSSRIAESPIPPLLDMLEPFPPIEEEPFVQTRIPNIIITPPTPGVEVGNHSKVVFRLPTQNAEKEKMKATRSAVVDPAEETVKEIKQPHTRESTQAVEDVIEKIPLHKNTVEKSQHKIESSNTNIPTGIVNSFAADTIELASEDHPGITNTLSTCEESLLVQADLETSKTQQRVSSINSSKPLAFTSEDGALSLKQRLQRRRKFWVPCDLTSFVKLRRNYNEKLKAKVIKKHRKISSQPKQGDTILNALKTLQQNNINFTISNDSIPLVQPYNYYSLLTPPKTEPLTVSRRFTDTFSDSLSCWNKRCTVNNTQMLLRKVPNEEEPELLGFFSIKSEVITPSVSRMAVMEKPKPFDSRDTMSELLKGIKELLEIQRKESFENRRKKRTKPKNRRSDFYSETETELEKLFRTSADVLGRNKRFLAAAKEQSFESTCESESDAMMDSGLVTGTPKIDSDSLSLCSQYELGEEMSNNMFTPIIRNDKTVVQENILQSHRDVLSPIKDNTGFAGFPLPNTSSETLKNDAPPVESNSTTPNFSTCPVMISPIASSKGSPKTLQGSSTPFKTPEFSSNAQVSPNCFKIPFCPDLISPMASSKGSPATQILRDKDTNEDSLDLFRVPPYPIMVSPLTLFSETNLDNFSNKSAIVGCTRLSTKSFPTTNMAIPQAIVKPEISNNGDVLNTSRINHISSDILLDEDKESVNDVNDRKCSEIKKSLVCQKITFDSFAKNETDDKSKILENNERTFNIDLSIKSTDLNYTLDDINISQLELTSISNGFTEPDKISVDDSYSKVEQDKSAKKNHPTKFVQRRYSLRNTSQSESKNELEPVFSEAKRRYSLERTQSETKNDNIKTVPSEAVKRYSLIRKSQFKGKNNNSLELEAMKIVSSDNEDDIAITSPRTRAAKRKFEEHQYPEKSTVTRLLKSPEHDEVTMPLKKKKGRPRKVNKTEPHEEDINDRKSHVVPPDRMSDKEIDSPGKGQKEKRVNSEKTITKKLFSLDVEDDDDPCFKGNNNSEQDAGNISDTSEGKVKREKRLLRKRSRTSEDLNSNNDKETSSNPSVRLYRKIISKEFISDSESECDMPPENVTETSSSARVKEHRSCIQGNSGITSEIQNILRSISKKEDQPKNNFVLSSINNDYKASPAKSNASLSSTKYLFGDFSDSGEESCDSIEDCKVKVKSKRITSKKNLKAKIMKQVKGTVYASTKNKNCDSIKKSCENKPEEVLSKGLKSVPSTDKEDKKINIVQNILITKGKAFNLLSNNKKDESLITVESSKSISEEPPQSDPTNKIQLKQNISNISSTPVDILSQVMQGMIKTGPKFARKNASNLISSRPVTHKEHWNAASSSIERKNIHLSDSKSCRVKENIAEVNPVEISNNADEYLDCPKSPDVLEVPDRLPKWIPTEKPQKLQDSKVRYLIDKLLVFSNEEKMIDDVIKEFAFQDVTYMTEIIIDKLSNDYHDQADCLFPPSPPMTSTQRTLLGFLLKLDNSTHPGIKEKFLSLAEMRLFSRFTCTLEIVQPITRLYTALCKLQFDLNKIRRFICEGFYFIGELAVPMLFTVLTMWPEVLPMESESSDHLLAKVLIQICYLKECNQPGYNFIPLRDLLKKYYGYPTERWNCEDIFQEIMVEYIRNPSIRLSDFTLLVFLKNKPTKWVYQKVKEVIIPLYDQTPESNPNLKATLVILLANICCSFRKYEENDWSVILEMDRWFIDLDKDDLDPIIKRAIHLARGRLPRRQRKKNKGANKNTEDNKQENEDKLDSLETHNGMNELSLENNREETIEDSCRTNTIEAAGRSIEENSQCTNNIVNIDNKLECNN